MLRREHPDGDYGAAVWRGRHADDPEAPDPDHSGKYHKMCLRSPEAKELEAALKKHHKSFEFKIYPGAKHGFHNDSMPERYNAEAAEDGWRRTLDFLKTSLR